MLIRARRRRAGRRGRSAASGRCAYLGSNQGPPACEAGALPLSYTRRSRQSYRTGGTVRPGPRMLSAPVLLALPTPAPPPAVHAADVVIGALGGVGSPAGRLVLAKRPGGLVLFGELGDGGTGLRVALRRAGLRPVLMIDQEGGSVRRVRSLGPAAPSALRSPARVADAARVPDGRQRAAQAGRRRQPRAGRRRRYRWDDRVPQLRIYPAGGGQARRGGRARPARRWRRGLREALPRSRQRRHQHRRRRGDRPPLEVRRRPRPRGVRRRHRRRRALRDGVERDRAGAVQPAGAALQGDLPAAAPDGLPRRDRHRLARRRRAASVRVGRRGRGEGARRRRRQRARGVAVEHARGHRSGDRCDAGGDGSTGTTSAPARCACAPCADADAGQIPRRSGRDSNPRDRLNTRLRDFQSRSFDHSDTTPRRAQSTSSARDRAPAN